MNLVLHLHKQASKQIFRLRGRYRDAFKEDEPRDESGKWTSGSSHSKSTEALSFTKEKKPVHSLHGVSLNSWTPPDNWAKVSGTKDIDEPPLPKGKRIATGLIMMEPDGRIWLCKPTNAYGGYEHTFPKGGLEKELSPQANAIKEAYEETGLKGEVTGYFGDYEGTTSVTRYYLGKRTGGSPQDHGWESEAVVLAPLSSANEYLNMPRDKSILKDLKAKHTHDAFKEEEHPRGKGGEFIGGGSSNVVVTPKRVKNEYGSDEFANYGRSIEDVPIEWLKKLGGNALRHDIDWVHTLGKDIKNNGLRSPLIINVGKVSRTAQLGEGNHRLRAMIMHGFTHAPARVVVGHEWGKSKEQPEGIDADIIPKEGEYFKEDAAPSEVFRSLKRTDDAEWKEEQHPRAKGGQFAKKGEAYFGGKESEKAVPSYKLVKSLVAAGFKKKKGMSPGGHFQYQDPDGNVVYIGGATPKQKVVFHGWRHKEDIGIGEEQLEQKLKELQGKQEEKLPEIEEPKGEPFVEPGHTDPVVNSFAEALGDFTPVKNYIDSVHYKNPQGYNLYIEHVSKAGKYSWTVSDPKGTITSKGESLAELNNKNNNGQIDIGTEQAHGQGIVEPKSQATVEAEKAITIPKHMANSYIHQKGEDSTGGFTDAYKNYDAKGQVKEIIRFNKDTGDWRYWVKGQGVPESGNGQDSFNQYFESLHPRGEGGKFAKKPGGEEPIENKKQIKDLLDSHGFAYETRNDFTTKYKAPSGHSLYISNQIDPISNGYSWTLYKPDGEMATGGDDLSYFKQKIAKEGISLGGTTVPKPSGAKQEDHDELIAAGYTPLGKAPWAHQGAAGDIHIYSKPDGTIVATKLDANQANGSIFNVHESVLNDPTNKSYQELKAMLGGKEPKQSDLSSFAGGKPTTPKTKYEIATDLGFTPIGNKDVGMNDLQVYTDPDGYTLHVDKDEWKLFGLKGETLEGGYSVFNMKNMIEKHISEPGGGGSLEQTLANIPATPKQQSNKVAISAGFTSAPTLAYGVDEYINPEGYALHINEKGWLLSKPGGGLEKGTTHTELSKALANIPKSAAITIHPEIAGDFVLKDSTSNPKFDKMYEKLDSSGYPIERVRFNSTTGDWSIWTDKNVAAIVGSGQASFDTAFEKLHPRDAQGHFIEKAGQIQPVNYVSKFGEAPEVGVTMQALGFNPIKKLGASAEGYVKYQNPTTGKHVYIYSSPESNGQYLYDAVDLNLGSGADYKELAQQIVTGGHATITAGGISAAGAMLTPTSIPKTAIDPKVLKLETLTKVGEKQGSNPGGTYLDADGFKYYIKHIDTNHSKNELLAAGLYGLAGGNTFKYHMVININTGQINVATKWSPLKKKSIDDFTPEEKKRAQQDFAIQVWIGNWDAAGIDNTNIGVDENGQVIPTDLGGSLLYRAQGEPKGSAWNGNASEWITLRDPTVNQKTADLYGSMTDTELAESAKKLAGITDSQIDQMVINYGPGGVADVKAMAEILKQRRDAILAKAGVAKVTAPTSLPPPPPAIHTPPGPHPDKPRSFAEADTVRKRLAAPSANRSSKVLNDMTEYKGIGYNRINPCMRYFDETCDEPEVATLQQFLGEHEIPEDVILYRGINGDIVQQYKKNMKVGRAIKDLGFMSVSTDVGTAAAFAAGSYDSYADTTKIPNYGMLFRIHVKKGAKGATVKRPQSDDGECELLMQRHSNLRFTSITPHPKYNWYEVELTQDEVKP